MFKNDIADAVCIARHFIDLDRFVLSGKVNIHRVELHGPGQLVKHTVGRCQDCRLPALCVQRERQVANDVAHAADLALGQCSVFGCQENDVPCTNKSLPSA